MPVSRDYKGYTKHKSTVSKLFPVLNKCPYCKTMHTTMEMTPLQKWLSHWHQACPSCVYKRHDDEGSGYMKRDKTGARRGNQ